VVQNKRRVHVFSDKRPPNMRPVSFLLQRGPPLSRLTRCIAHLLHCMDPNSISMCLPRPILLRGIAAAAMFVISRTSFLAGFSERWWGKGRGNRGVIAPGIVPRLTCLADCMRFLCLFFAKEHYIHHLRTERPEKCGICAFDRMNCVTENFSAEDRWKLVERGREMGRSYEMQGS
jgi:hypothetical protein